MAVAAASSPPTEEPPQPESGEAQPPAALDQFAIARQLLPLSDPELKKLMERRPARVWRDVLRCYALIGCGIALLATDSWLVWPIVFVLIGTQQHALFILAHDGMHSTLLPHRRANDLLTEALLFAPLGMSLGDQKSNHLGHHRWLSTERDPDRFLHRASNKATVSAFLLFLSGLLTIVPSVTRVTPLAGPGRRRDAIKELLLTRWPAFLAQALILALFAVVSTWWHYFVFWVLPVYALVAVPNQVRAFCEHAQPVVPDTAGDPDRLVTFRPGFLERQLIAPFNMHRHAEHHLWAFVPYFNLPKLDPIVRHHPDIEVRGSYAAFLRDYFRKLPLLP